MALTHRKNQNLEVKNRVKVENQVDRKDIVSEEKRITFPVTIRVTNHTRNQIQALGHLGTKSTLKEVVEELVQLKVDSLTDSDKARYLEDVNTLETKDYLSKK